MLRCKPTITMESQTQNQSDSGAIPRPGGGESDSETQNQGCVHQVKMAQKRKKQTDEERKFKAKEYEASKRKRGFVTSWLTEFKWLLFLEDEGVMICRVCSKVDGQTGPFVTGSTSFHKESLNKHARSESHIMSVVKVKAREAKPGTSEAEKALQKLKKSAVERLKIMFLTCHALSKHGRPFTDFKWHCNLDKAKGLDVGSTYHSDKQAKLFTEFIAKAERRKQKQELAGAPFISIITDGSTDCSITEQEIHYVRFAIQGEIKHICLGIESVEKANAIHLVEAIERSFKIKMEMDTKDWEKKLVGLGSDGASVMLGKNGGVAAILKRTQPCMVAVHCTAHRLELAFKDAMKKCNIFKTLLALLLNVYLFYHGSCLNRAMLRRAFSATNLPCMMPSRVGGTRWVAHTEKALKKFTKGYPAWIMHMEQVGLDNFILRSRSSVAMHIV